MYCHGRRSFPRIHVTPPRRKRRRLLILPLVVSLAANVLLLATRGGPKVGQWRSTSARETYLAAYREVAASMPAAQERDIATSWGTVHVALFPGPEGSTKAPILLLPGWGAGIPMWRDLLPVLARERPVYAVDALGDAGLSTQSVPLGKPEANAGWISETLTALEAPPVHVVGHSFGGWLATNFALHHPEQTVSLSLFDPVQTFSTLTWEVYLWAIPASIPLLPQSWRDAALARISGNETIDHNDPLTRLIDAGTKGYSSARDLPQHALAAPGGAGEGRSCGSRLHEPPRAPVRARAHAGRAAAASMSIHPESCTDRSRSVVHWRRAGFCAGWFHSGPKLGNPSASLAALRQAASAEERTMWAAS